MNANEALKYADSVQFGSIVETLATEIKRLRKQREALYDAIPAGNTCVKEMFLISKEVEDGRQEKEKKKEITVDEAISEVKRNCASLITARVLVEEVKRLREEIKSKDKKEKQLCLRQDSNYAQIRLLSSELQKLHALNVTLCQTPPACRAVFNDELNIHLREKDKEINCLREQCEMKDKVINELREEVKEKEVDFQVATEVKVNLWGEMYDVLEALRHS